MNKTIATSIAACAAFSMLGQVNALTLGPDFVADYTVVDLGTPAGVPFSFGGLNMLAGTNDTLLLGGQANTNAGRYYEVDVIRDGDNHITGFTGDVRVFGDVGEFNDGGIAYGPGGVLFTARWPSNELGQTLPGATDEARVDDVSADVASYLAALNFVPTGFAGAGNLKFASWSGGEWYDVALSPDGSGTFDIDSITQVDLDPLAAGIQNLPGGPEGFVFIGDGNKGFDLPSLLVSDYSAGQISAYDLDANSNPLVSTRRVFLDDLRNAEGAFIDPLTGDFLFSTFGTGSDRIVQVRGFVPIIVDPPVSTIPLPASALLLFGGLAGLGLVRRRKG